MRKIILLFVACFYPLIGFSQVKTYELKMSPCELGTQCKKCNEIVSVKYEVDSKSKLVEVSSKSVNGEAIKEVSSHCDIKDELNWSCNFSTIKLFVSNNSVSITTNKNSSLYSSGKEVCLVK